MSKEHPSSSRSSPAASGLDRVFWGVSLCFVLSGVAALLYQIVWMRLLSTIFGTSELAIVTVLVAYMGGLAVGAGVAARWVGRLARPIRVYAMLEGVIALSAVLVPLLLRVVSGLHRAILGGQEAPPSDGGLPEALAFLGLGCAVLLIPTACMGATLPILAAGVIRKRGQIGRRVGWLYALNTFGAVGGVLLAAFVLIPRLGLWQTSFVGAGLNVLVAVLGWLVAMRGGAAGESEEPLEAEQVSGQGGVFGRVILGVMLCSGALAFAYEVLWSRLLSFVLGGSLYAFATMLAAFLVGIALGGMLGAPLASSRRRACFGLAVVEIAAGLVTAFLYLRVSADGFASGREGEAGFGALPGLCMLVLVPVTVCLGATFPLAVRALCEDPRQAGRQAGKVYSWNTMGAIAGAIGAGYFLIPSLGFAGTFKLAIVGNLILGAVVLVAMQPRPVVPAGLAGLLVLGGVIGFRPDPPLALMTRSPLGGEGRPGASAELIHHAVGHSATVAVLKRRGNYLIRTNGLPEAEIFGKGAENLGYTRIRWLPALPKVLRPETESLLVVGFGGGALLERVPPGIKAIDVLELEEEVIRANRLLAERRAIDPFRDPRLNVVINDVRGALGLTTRRYDAIVSQPSHPWTAGASHLYTREFFELAKAHLHDDGVFVQWLGTHFVDEPLLRSFAATMVAVFPHTQLYKIADNFLFVGSEVSLDERYLAGAGPDGSLLGLSGYAKMSCVEDVLAALQLDEEGMRQLAGDSPVITDDRNLMATQQGFGGGLEGAMSKAQHLRRVLGPIHVLNRGAGRLKTLLGGAPLDYHYLIGQVRTSGSHLDLGAFEASLPREEVLLQQALATRARSVADSLPILDAVLDAAPEHGAARAIAVQTRMVQARRTWAGQGRGGLPAELGELLDLDPALRAAVQELTELQRTAVQAEHWVLTGQVARARSVIPRLEEFTDHRDPYFQSASEVRVRVLLDGADKTDAEQERDTRAAVALLDDLLARPLGSNLGLVNRRIQLAHQLGDLDYLVAAGWIMVGRLASAPSIASEQMKDVYRTPLGEILQPYFGRDEKGRIQFSNPIIEEFYAEVRRQVGVTVFPEAFRP